MKFPIHSRVALSLLISLSFSAPLAVFAQDVLPTAKILVISREFTKPGKDGAPHEMVEGAYPRALAAGKIPNYYYAAVSLSGPSRALFFHGYSSFADMAAAHNNAISDSALSATLDRTTAADGDLLSSKDYSIWQKRDDLSLNPGFRVGSRYVEILQFNIRPGHYQEWEQLVKLVTDGYKKAVPDFHWATYEEAYGSPGGSYLVITSLKSATELDAAEARGKKFAEAMGADGLKKLDELEAACVESRNSNLFVIDPKMSYPPEAWVKADPGFWMPAKK
jgi:hypothetical protein